MQKKKHKIAKADIKYLKSKKTYQISKLNKSYNAQNTALTRYKYIKYTKQYNKITIKTLKRKNNNPLFYYKSTLTYMQVILDNEVFVKFTSCGAYMTSLWRSQEFCTFILAWCK